MPETFFEKWHQRFIGAWGVLTGNAFVSWYSSAYALPKCKTCGKTPENIGWCSECGYNRNY